jgi:hypothetical protein
VLAAGHFVGVVGGRCRIVTRTLLPASSARRALGNGQIVIDDALGNLSHGQPEVHRGLLDPPERRRLIDVQRLLQQVFGSLDEVAGL